MQSQTKAPDTSVPASERRGFGWGSLQVLGAVLLMLVPVIPFLAEGIEPFFLIFVVPPLIGLTLRRFAPRVGIAWLGVVSLALLVMNAPFIPEAIAHPESSADFIPIAMFAVGALVAVVATIPAFRAVRGTASDSTLPNRLAIASLVALAIAAGGSLVARSGVTSDAPASGSIRVSMESFQFGPETVTAQGGRVSLYVTNNDSVRHTFTVDSLGIDTSVAPGQSRLIEFEAAPGEYRFYCKPHDPGMEGDLLVR